MRTEEEGVPCPWPVGLPLVWLCRLGGDGLGDVISFRSDDALFVCHVRGYIRTLKAIGRASRPPTRLLLLHSGFKLPFRGLVWWLQTCRVREDGVVIELVNNYAP